MRCWFPCVLAPGAGLCPRCPPNDGGGGGGDDNKTTVVLYYSTFSDVYLP